MKELISRGIEEKLIDIDYELGTIKYCNHNKARNYNNPEEKIQAIAFLKLVLEYGYNPEDIKQFVTIQMGSSQKEADIVVYNDKEHLSPYIVVECKKEDISELEFKNAVNQAFSYAVADGAKYVWTTSSIKNEYYQVPKKKPKDRMTIVDIPKFSQKYVPKYKYAKGDKKYNELEIVSEDSLTQRFKQAHNALWAGGELNPSEAFDELDKLIFCKIWDERNCKRGEPYKFQVIPHIEQDNDNEEQENKALTEKNLLDRINELYEQGRKKDPEVFKDGVRLNASKVRTVVGYLEGINLSKTDLDSKGRAFETFMGSFFRGDFGQYFTPRAIVKFIVDVLPIAKDSFVLDTSCGSGGFLLHALDKVRQQADKEFPNYESDPDERLDWKKYWYDFAENNLYGIEINEQIARTAKMNMIIHDDGHTNVISCDGLLPIAPKPKPIEAEEQDVREIRERENENTIQIKGKNDRFKPNYFDFILTNPPFGSSVKQTEKAYLHQYGFGLKNADWLDLKGATSKRKNQSTEVLFIEQAHNFLKAGTGILAIVIPDGILTNSSLQYVRDSIEEMYRIIAVISMPQSAFSATGAGVKSSVLFLKKYTEKQTENIQKQKLKLQSDLLQKHKYAQKFKALDDEKKSAIKELNARYEKGSEELKEAKAKLSKEFSEKINELKDMMREIYSEEKKQILARNDYEIFMAIAENIGYDATGKPTEKNELDYIALRLKDFIESLENE